MRSPLNVVFKEVDENYQNIKKTYELLEYTYNLKLSIHPAGQWLLDNMYILDEEYLEIVSEQKSLKNKMLPAIKTHDGEKYIAIFYLAHELIENNTGYIDQNIILNCLREHQKYSYLTSEELDLFSLMLRAALIKFIARISKNIYNSQIQKINVERILTKGLENTTVLTKMLNQDFKNFKYNMVDIGKIKNTNTSFVEYMAFRIKELGDKGDKFYSVLNEESDKIGFTVEEAIIKEHMEMAKTTEYIGRAILAFRQINGINYREVFEKVNKIDETLMNDYTNEFRKCDYKTKARYRRQIIRLARKYSLSEVYIAKKAIEVSYKYKKHVGFFLIGDYKYILKKELGKAYRLEKLYNEKIKPINSYLYVFSIIIIGLLISLLCTISIYNFDNVWLNIFVAITSFAFGMEIWEKIISYMFRKNLKPKILPRFDFAKSIDEQNTTYVIMPSVISSIEKLDDAIDKMETTYLANRSNNMYYMLIGDCISSDKKEIDIDKYIVEYAKNKLETLNKKYPADHKLFNFMYRKRRYSKGENAYMGYERKRGAISEFNKLVLNKLSNEQIDRTMYLIYDDIIEAKYAITIDEDTTLSLNTAKDLVSIMAHPLNKPILSKDRTIVVKGYGLIQPSVGLDIEAANKSIFSKIFGGFGGLDIYTTAVSNVYQDGFGEAIFCGKGIYDIQLFEELLEKEIPENLVLSHDLLEGSYLRAGLASDIEVQDGFPSNYIAYMKRNHRWYRGDVQILRWLFSPNSKLNFLSKWKIFDNIRRPLVSVFAILALIVSLFVSTQAFINTVIITFLGVNFGYLISIIDIGIFGKSTHMKEVQYIPLIHGIKAILLTMFFNYITLPYRAYMFLDAQIRSLYRMFVSKKHLLEWTTAEVLDKKAKNSFIYYLNNMTINVVFGVFVLIFAFANIINNHTPVNYFVTAVMFSLFYILAPLFAYLLGKSHLFGRKQELTKIENEEIIDVAKRTWLFFDSVMTPINNYLPTDNYQENRRHKIVNRTSCTNIGFGLLAIISAYDLKFIDKQAMIEKLSNVFNTIEKLEKWNGHLLNWYNIKTLEPLRPRFVSTVDSGNFVASLLVVKEFLESIIEGDIGSKKDESLDYNLVQKLIDKTDEYIKNTDFTKLYDTSKNLFSIGYAQEEGKLVDSYYDMLMSESRITSLIAIATRQVTSKHWFSLSRNLVNIDGLKGLISWTGTSFEYFMPYLFNKSYEHTLIDQSLFFAKYSQKKYCKENSVPWGISESAFAVRDNDLNYQYQAFGVPWLGLKRGLNDYMVISPYASFLTIEYSCKDVYKNMKKLKKLGAYSTFGFYEAIDFTKQHIADNKDYEVVKTYMAHHQGMILVAINNYINHGIIKERFHSNPDIAACDILLKERERNKNVITKKVDSTNTKFKQKDTDEFTSFVMKKAKKYDIKSKEDVKEELCISALRGKNLSSIYTNLGSSYIRYDDKIVNNQKYTDLLNSGNFIYLTDKVTSESICVTGINKYIKKSSFSSNLNGVEYYRETDNLEVTTKIFLSQEFNYEVAKVSVYNNSNKKREIIINTYLEPVLTDYMTNVVHPAFNNLQIETYYDNDLDILVAKKRVKKEDDKEIYAYTKLIGIDLDIDIETEKSKLNSIKETAYDTNISRYPLWPILSYRTSIILDPHERQEFYYVTGVEDNKYKISNAVVNMDDKTLDKQYKFGFELGNVIARYLELKPGIAMKYNQILKEILFEKPNIDMSTYWNENLNQSMLWKYSISGDLPIILVYVNKIEDSGIVDETIKFMDYSKNRKIALDIVILVDEEILENGPIYTYIKMRVDRARYMDYTNGNIYVLNINNLNNSEINLFTLLSKKYITDIDEFFEKDNEKYYEVDEKEVEESED